MTNHSGGREHKGTPGKWHAAWRFVARRLQLPEDASGLALALVMLAACMGGLAAVVFVDPVTSRWFPQCLFHRLTGLDCPGCGTARALHALVHGDWKAAWRHNAILFAALPFLAAIIIRPTWAKRPKVVGTVIAAIVLWGMLRNLPKWL